MLDDDVVEGEEGFDTGDEESLESDETLSPDELGEPEDEGVMQPT